MVVVNEDLNNGFMHRVDFGKRQRASHQPRKSLAHRVAESLAGTILIRWHDGLTRFPKVDVPQAAFVALGNALPQQLTRFEAAPTQSIGHGLACATTQRQPQPAFVFALFNK
jgi:hypothetical protein